MIDSPMDTMAHYQVFGADEKPTIYYLCGYRSVIDQYHLPIAILNRAGFRVMAFDYDDRVLNGGDPTYLVNAVHETIDAVEADKADREVAGTYGVSLGSFIGLSIIRREGVQRAIFNTGGVKMSSAIWHAPRLKAERAAFEDNGFSKAALEAAWSPYESLDDGTRLSGKKILIMDSIADEIVNYSEAAETVRSLQVQGIDVRLLTVRGLSHARTIVRNIARVRTTVKFFRGHG